MSVWSCNRRLLVMVAKSNEPTTVLIMPVIATPTSTSTNVTPSWARLMTDQRLRSFAKYSHHPYRRHLLRLVTIETLHRNCDFL
jgi:hypothetical protein